MFADRMKPLTKLLKAKSDLCNIQKKSGNDSHTEDATAAQALCALLYPSRSRRGHATTKPRKVSQLTV